MILLLAQLGPPPSPPPNDDCGFILFCIGLVLQGAIAGVVVMSVLYVHSRGFRKYWGASKCIYCDAPPKVDSFICYKHTHRDEVEI